MSQAYRPSRSVHRAQTAGRAIVALESTIVTHGMPWPSNCESAREVEARVRQHGAEPATIAVLDGELRIGLEDDELEQLAQHRDCLKLSRADLAYAISSGRTGSTTVAATMIAARLAGIDVFATGGIGGVHRGAESSFDISADLGELARTAVVVVCAGAKAILDLPKTVEYLETAGVPVIAWGQDPIPAFWSRDSGIAAPLRFDEPVELVDFLRARQSIGLEGGVLIANPVPEDKEIPRTTLEPIIARAIDEASALNIAGKAVTPWLLSRLAELTEGRSLASNRSLILANAALAARLAVALNEGRDTA